MNNLTVGTTGTAVLLNLLPVVHEKNSSVRKSTSIVHTSTQVCILVLHLVALKDGSKFSQMHVYAVLSDNVLNLVPR